MRLKKEDFVGKVFENSLGLEFEIIDLKSYYDVTVRFKVSGFTTTARLDHIKRGAVRDRFHRENFGVGYLGSMDGVVDHQRLRSKWGGMLNRCYNNKYHESKPTYKECKVSEYFQNFTNFYLWAKGQVGFNIVDWELDKDILLRGNKIYSEDTCVFVPREINTLIFNSDGKFSGVRFDNNSKKWQVRVNKLGVSLSFGYYEDKDTAMKLYAREKENVIREVAEKWKGKIDDRAYNALINWNI